MERNCEVLRSSVDFILINCKIISIPLTTSVGEDVLGKAGDFRSSLIVINC